MYLIEVIPISRGVGTETLSYFSKVFLTPGTVVKVPLRSRFVPALVIASIDARESKTEIRSARFELKKIEAIGSSHLITQQAILAARETARFFACTTGAVLNHLIPKAILEAPEEIANGTKYLEDKKNTVIEKFVLQTDDDDRMAHYRSIIRESFARGHSVFFCVPTTHDAGIVRDRLSRGIEEYTLTLHASLPKNQILKLWNLGVSNEHPMLIIGTGLFISIPRNDIRTIIIEKEHSSGYRTQSRPFLDFRVYARIYAEKINSSIIFGDSLLRIETLWNAKEDHFVELAPIKFRSLSRTNQQIIDMREYSKSGIAGHFSLFSKELMSVLGKADTELKKVILFASRRGFASETICGDCGNIVRCKTCDTPIVLHKSVSGNSSNFFLRHNCGERRDAEERCSVCESWKLIPLGIGTEKVEQEINKNFPSLPCFRLDNDTAKTQASALRIIKKFTGAVKGVLVGTEAIFHQNIEPVDTSAIISIDSLFAVPDFRIHEKIVHLIFETRELSKNTFLLQTRNPEEDVLRDAHTGHLADFYRREISTREQFNYPPFSVLIKVTVEGTKLGSANLMESLKEMIAPRTINIFPAYVKSRRGKHALHGVIKIPRNEWVDQRLLQTLLSLTPNFTVSVNPESIL